jgi:hypothetical protein
VFADAKRIVATAAVPASLASKAGELSFCPDLVRAALDLLPASQSGGPWLPLSAGRMATFGAAPAEIAVCIDLHAATGSKCKVDITLLDGSLDGNGTPFLRIEQLTVTSDPRLSALVFQESSHA